MKWKKVLQGVLLLMAAAVVALGIWQWDNIKLVYKALTTDKETISSNLEETRDKHKQELQEKSEIEITVNRPSPEQSEALINGQVTADDVKNELGLITNPNTNNEDTTNSEAPNANTPDNPAKEPETTSPPETPTTTVPDINSNEQNTEAPTAPPQAEPLPEAPAESQSQLTAQELVNLCVSEMYAYEVELMEQLGVMRTEMLDTWKALEPEQRTQTKKIEIGMAGLRECYKLEVSVDADVQAILERYKVLLTEINADVAILDTLWEQYCDEKETQKAYYLNLYLD